jgi:hypothetical protein
VSDKQHIAYADREWYAAFARIQIRQKLSAGGISYRVAWKHFDPDWVQLTFRAGKKQESKIVRKGDSLLLELRHE